MRDLSLHLLDLAQNSISAGASLVTVRISVDGDGILTMELEDNGRGMSRELLERVTSPFATTRTTRKVGLGIPMMKENAEKAGGSFHPWTVLKRSRSFFCSGVGAISPAFCSASVRQCLSLPNPTGVPSA